jgi:hypothetical protein
MIPSVHYNPFRLVLFRKGQIKEKNHASVQARAVDGGHRTRSGRSGNVRAGRLLRFRRLLRRLFRLRQVAASGSSSSSKP